MKWKLFLIVLALQTAWLLGTVIVQERALSSGRTILLETRRLDPRDLLRGDYLILNYKISDVPVDAFSPRVPANLKPGTKIYVLVAPAGTNQFYEVTHASSQPLVPAGDEVLLQGESGLFRWQRSNSIHITYGIERYYVAEGTGNPRGKLTVQAGVPASGKPRIKEVFVDGRPYAEAMRR